MVVCCLFFVLCSLLFVFCSLKSSKSFRLEVRLPKGQQIFMQSKHMISSKSENLLKFTV